MKKRNYWFYVIMFFINFGTGLSQADRQWYIHGGNGKVAGITSVGNNFGSDQISNSFMITGVGYPDPPKERNDLFIIYEDSTFFNSRGNTSFVLNASNNLPDSAYLLKTEKNPLYLYYTNLYEGDDDPPPFVEVINGTSSTLNTTIITHTTPNDLLTANHDIRSGRDITIIVKKHYLSENNPVNYVNLEFQNAIMSPYNVFKLNQTTETFIFPASSNDNYITGDNFVTLDFSGNVEYKFVNFRVNTLPDSMVNKWIPFNLINPGNPNPNLFTLNEKVVDSHDPNYIEVLNIFEKEPGEYWAHMHVQCYNDSRDAHVNDAQLALTMPSTVDAASLEMTDWSYGMTQGALPDVTMKKNGDRIYFNFGAVPDILNMQGPDYNYVDPSQVAWVEYIVRINSNNSAEVAKINLKPIRPMTFFDGTPYDITRYIDRCFGNLSDRTDLCERKIMGPYYMGQFTETMALGSHTTSEAYSGSEENQNCCKHHCGKDRCKNDCDKNQCKDKCCKKKKRFWRNVIPWVIAGVMTVIAIAD